MTVDSLIRKHFRCTSTVLWRTSDCNNVRKEIAREPVNELFRKPFSAPFSAPCTSTVKMAMIVASAFLLLSSCTTEQLPVGAHLIITPQEHTIKIIENHDADGRCLFNPDFYVDLPVVITLLDANDSPIGDHDVSVYLDFAANTFSGYSMLALYKDFNSNGVVDGDEELVSGVEDNIAAIRTHTLYGSQTLLLRVNISCSFIGSITAISGGVVGTASISIVTEDTRVVTEPEAKT